MDPGALDCLFIQETRSRGLLGGGAPSPAMPTGALDLGRTQAPPRGAPIWGEKQTRLQPSMVRAQTEGQSGRWSGSFNPQPRYQSPERGRDLPHVTRHTGPPDPGVCELCKTDVQRHMTPRCGDAQTRTQRRTPPSHVSWGRRHPGPRACRGLRDGPQGPCPGQAGWEAEDPGTVGAGRELGGLAWAVSPRRGTTLGPWSWAPCTLERMRQ